MADAPWDVVAARLFGSNAARSICGPDVRSQVRTLSQGAPPELAGRNRSASFSLLRNSPLRIEAANRAGLTRSRNVYVAGEYSVNGRRFAQTVYDTLKIAGRRQIERLNGPTHAATLSRALQSHLSKAISVDWPDSYMCIDQALDYDSLVGEPVIVRAMADALGCDVVARVSKPSTETLQALTGRMAKEFGEAADKCLHDEQNADETIRELRDLAEIVNTLIATLTTRHTLRAVG